MLQYFIDKMYSFLNSLKYISSLSLALSQSFNQFKSGMKIASALSGKKFFKKHCKTATLFNGI